MIIEKILEKKSAGIKQYPCRSNRASECGHPCERYLVYCRTNWQDKALHDVSLQLIFDIGVDIENRLIKDLLDAGVQVIEQQRSFEMKSHDLTGHIDCKILVDGYAAPCEIKSMSPYTFDAVNKLEDMMKGKYIYLRKYPAQLMLYLLMDNKEWGLFILKNKSTGAMKEIRVDLDYEYTESILKRIEMVNAHIRANTFPERMEYSDKLCGECPFQHICIPDRKVDELKFKADPELEQMIDKYFELKPIAKEYNDIDEILKEKLRDINAVIGNYLISGKWIEKKTYNIPEDIKTQFMQIVKYWKKEIKKI